MGSSAAAGVFPGSEFLAGAGGAVGSGVCVPASWGCEEGARGEALATSGLATSGVPASRLAGAGLVARAGLAADAGISSGGCERFGCIGFGEVRGRKRDHDERPAQRRARSRAGQAGGGAWTCQQAEGDTGTPAAGGSRATRGRCRVGSGGVARRCGASSSGAGCRGRAGRNQYICTPVARPIGACTLCRACNAPSLKSLRPRPASQLFCPHHPPLGHLWSRRPPVASAKVPPTPKRRGRVACRRQER